jgi:hypothetical protein
MGYDNGFVLADKRDVVVTERELICNQNVYDRERRVSTTRVHSVKIPMRHQSVNLEKSRSFAQRKEFVMANQRAEKIRVIVRTYALQDGITRNSTVYIYIFRTIVM